MAHKQISLAYKDGQTLFGHAWVGEDRDNVKGNLVIIHGMAEYSFRYNEMAEYLNKKGYDVYAVDHIGHGLAVSQDPTTPYKYGMWPKDGFDQNVERAKALVDYVHTISDKPVFVLGHSLGSFLATSFYEKHSESIKGVIICGSAYNNATYRMSSALTGIMNVFKTKKQKNKASKILLNAQDSTLNKGVKPFADGYNSNTKWLSYNEDNVKRYDKDKECGFPCDFMFYYSMFHGQQKAWSKKALKGIKEKKPVYIIAGHDDPVGNYGKGPEALYKFIKSNQDNVKLRLFDHMRHEIHNEDQRQMVFDDLAAFMDANLK
jgi:alpha-beta hydrolase superfamily lysophospholipase